MEFAAATQKLASYKPRKSERSREVLQKGVALLKNNTHIKQGDEGKHLVYY